jgi:hypothetical protein
MKHVAALGLVLTLGAPTPGDTIVQEGFLSGYPGQVETFEIPLQQFDIQDGLLQLNFVQLDFLTSFVGGAQSTGEGGQHTRIHVVLDADYFLDGELLAETHAETKLVVHHNGPPLPISFFDSDEAHVTLLAPDELQPWIGTGEIVMTAEVLFLFEETPPGGASASAGGSVDWSVTYDFGPADGGTTTFSEDFEDLANQDGWSWGTGNEEVIPLNGNPGAFLADLTLFSAHPILFTAPGSESEFTGDYRASGVTSVGVDLIVMDTDFGVGSRPLTLMLTNDRDTPGDYDDDLWAWFVGDKEVPQAGVPGFDPTPPGWADFDFEIPSDSLTVPEGWQIFEMEGMTPDEVWNGVVTDVDTVEFWYGEPGTIFPFLSWDVGADNMRITRSTAAPLPGDLNGDGVVNHLDLKLPTSTAMAWWTCSMCGFSCSSGTPTSRVSGPISDARTAGR